MSKKFDEIEARICIGQKIISLLQEEINQLSKKIGREMCLGNGTQNYTIGSWEYKEKNIRRYTAEIQACLQYAMQAEKAVDKATRKKGKLFKKMITVTIKED